MRPVLNNIITPTFRIQFPDFPSTLRSNTWSGDLMRLPIRPGSDSLYSAVFQGQVQASCYLPSWSSPRWGPVPIQKSLSNAWPVMSSEQAALRPVLKAEPPPNIWDVLCRLPFHTSIQDLIWGPDAVDCTTRV